jgi:hypothetical protein
MPWAYCFKIGWDLKKNSQMSESAGVVKKN